MSDEGVSVPEEASARLAPELRKIRRAQPPHGKGTEQDDHRGHRGSVRTRRYRDHVIEIVAHYEITIDGEPWNQHVQVMDDGTVHYHGMPQYSPPSLVDLMERVVDMAYAAPEEVLEAARKDM
ncbi:MAG: hypothetical protein OES13_10660 [Acidimicrobiia bacterium]|nr:hypothetical protein [Acidimicrobiia bacterium]